MGIFNSVVLYRADTGKVSAVVDMDTTHLLNAINHHRTQVATIDFIMETLELNKAGKSRLLMRQAALINTISVLAVELTRRDASEDEVEVAVRTVHLDDVDDFLHNHRDW